VQRRQQRIRQVFEQGYLLFTLDTGRLGYVEGWRLDANRLMIIELFLADLHYLFAINGGLFPDTAVLALAPFPQHQAVSTL